MLSSIIIVVVPIFVTLGILRKYRESKWGKFRSQKSLAGKVFLITGANSGIGKETTRGLVERHAKVIMACRDVNSAKKAIADIRKTTSNGEMVPLYVDLQSLDSIRTFTNVVLQDFPKIHVLINNAGVSMPVRERQMTDDGFEVHFQVNYLGHFLLTKLLLERMKESAPSRIVVVSSSLHERGVIDFDNLNGEKGWTLKGHTNPQYCNTKLMNTYFGYELLQRLKNTGVSVYTLCPGFCKTGLMRHSSIKWYHWPALIVAAFLFMRTAKQGSQTVLHCAAAEELEKQDYWLRRDCKAYYSKHNFTPETSRKLWEYSETLIARAKKRIKNPSNAR